MAGRQVGFFDVDERLQRLSNLDGSKNLPIQRRVG
jgi:hypothetical protein